MLSRLVGLVGLTVMFMAMGCAPSLAVAPQLVAAWPVSGASMPIATHTFSFTFNRPLQVDSTWAAVWHDDDGAPVQTDVAVDPGNPRRLLVKLVEPAAGAFRLHWHASAARASAGSDGETDFVMHDEAVGAPHLAVSGSPANSGDRIELTGRGFLPRSTVALTIGDEDQDLTTVISDQHGAFSTEVHVPLALPFGTQRVSAVDGSGRMAQAALQVRWGGWPPLLGFTATQPGPARGEVTFWLSLRNRSDYVLEGVRVILNEPDGGTFVGGEPPPVEQAGTLVWDISTVDRGVAGPMRATFRVSGTVASHARIEFRHRRPRDCAGDECLSAFVSETTSDSSAVSPAE